MVSIFMYNIETDSIETLETRCVQEVKGRWILFVIFATFSILLMLGYFNILRIDMIARDENMHVDNIGYFISNLFCSLGLMLLSAFIIILDVLILNESNSIVRACRLALIIRKEKR